MHWEPAVAISALAISLMSMFFAGQSVRHARRSANAAEAQVHGQKEAREAVVQPYIWADVRGNDDQGTLIEVVVGNSGPTVAQSVQVRFDPMLPTEAGMGDLTQRALERLSTGIGSLAPGKTLRWTLGRGRELLAKDRTQIHRVTIDALGPFGPIEQLTYEIDLADFRESVDSPRGTLHRLTKAVTEVSAEIKAARQD